jgi:hypothetical protein
MSTDATERVAFALFADIYGNLEDDPTFARRVWDELPTAQRTPWYRQARIAIDAMNAAGMSEASAC